MSELYCKSVYLEQIKKFAIGNENNKRCLIAFLFDAFRTERVEVTVAEEDTDNEIVMTALSKRAVADRVVIVGEDVDLLVFLNGLCTEETNV